MSCLWNIEAMSSLVLCASACNLSPRNSTTTLSKKERHTPVQGPIIQAQNTSQRPLSVPHRRYAQEILSNADAAKTKANLILRVCVRVHVRIRTYS
jgi:hypothetical protein